MPTAADALIDYTLSFENAKDIWSVNPIVGETNDSRLNDIRGRHIRKEHVLEAIKSAVSGPVEEGVVGAGLEQFVLVLKEELELHLAFYLTS